MVRPISEDAARTALLQVASEASNAEFFKAERRDHGWVFGWRLDRGAPPMGTRTWIVADNGRVRMLGYKDDWDSAIAQELAN